MSLLVYRMRYKCADVFKVKETWMPNIFLGFRTLNVVLNSKDGYESEHIEVSSPSSLL